MRIVINPRKPIPAMAPPQGGRHTAIAPVNLQAVLDSAANAVHKGQAAWFTPVPWAEALALALPSSRPVMVDLTCGNGQLLAGAAAPGTFHRLGCDIEALGEIGSNVTFVQADVTLLANYLHRANWMADCFVLNFPFDHHMYRDRLAFLGESNCRAVEMAFSKHDGRTSEGTIDSTVAGLCLALDRCSPWGEGYIIAMVGRVNMVWRTPSLTGAGDVPSRGSAGRRPDEGQQRKTNPSSKPTSVLRLLPRPVPAALAIHWRLGRLSHRRNCPVRRTPQTRQRQHRGHHAPKIPPFQNLICGNPARPGHDTHKSG